VEFKFLFELDAVSLQMCRQSYFTFTAGLFAFQRFQSAFLAGALLAFSMAL
jgi:hypothetical protein